MFRTTLAALIMSGALMAPVASAEAGPLRKAVRVGAAVVLTGLAVRCIVRTANNRTCL